MTKVLLIVLSLLLFRCSEIAGTSDETSTRSARVLNPDLTPAKGAKVELFLSGDTTRLPIKVAYCDNKGECRFDVHLGYYNIWVENDSLTAFKDSVLFNPSPVDTSSMILNKTGGISGFIRLQPGDNPVEVYVGVLGTYKYCNVDEQGAFVLTGLAQGEYTLRLVNTKNVDYTPTFYAVRCISDSILKLKDTISLVFSGIPAVKGITVQFDSVTGQTRVSWNRSSYIYLDRYIVYRRLSTAPYNQNKAIGMTSDTSFIDTTAGSINGSIRYSIAILSQTGKYGNAYTFSDINVAMVDSLLRNVSPVHASSVESGETVHLAWIKIPNASSYQMQLSNDRSFSDTVKLITLPDTQVSVTSLASSCYFWRIRAMNSSNQYGPWSTPWMFGVGVFTYKIGALDEFYGGIKMAGNKYGQLIVKVSNSSAANIVLIDSAGRTLWQKQIIPDEIDGPINVQNVFSSDDYFLVELSLSYTSTMVIKYSNTGTELWRKKMKRAECLQIVKHNNNIMAGTEQGEISMFTTDGYLLNDLFIGDSLDYVVQQNDTSFVYAKSIQQGILLKEYRTTTKVITLLDSIYYPRVLGAFYMWTLNDGSVNVCIGDGVEYTAVLNISPSGTVKIIKMDKIEPTDYPISLVQNNEMTAVIFSNRKTSSLDIYDCDMNIRGHIKNDDYPNLDDRVHVPAWDINKNLDIYFILRVSTTDQTKEQAYLLRFPINGKYMLPSEVGSQ
jgi:hypothetical protein